MKLIQPDIKYKDSFLEMAHDLLKDGHWWGPNLDLIKNDFSTYLQKLEDMKSGLGLETNQAPGTEYWILEKGEIAGRLKVNHELLDWMKIRGGHIGYGICSKFRKKGLATEALKEALLKARALGIHDVLLTCDEDNIGSIKVIERNGGKLADKIMAPGRSIQTCRFIVRFS